jgi:hypothetical protein
VTEPICCGDGGGWDGAVVAGVTVRGGAAEPPHPVAHTLKQTRQAHREVVFGEVGNHPPVRFVDILLTSQCKSLLCVPDARRD